VFDLSPYELARAAVVLGFGFCCCFCIVYHTDPIFLLPLYWYSNVLETHETPCYIQIPEFEFHYISWHVRWCYWIS
jgi:hypothetical protein